MAGSDVMFIPRRMHRSPAFKKLTIFYPDSKVILMRNEAVGCCIKLICHGWLEGSIPNNIGGIAKLCFCHSEKMATLWEEIKLCYITHPKDPEKLIHPRLEKERKKQVTNRKERVSAGKKGAKARWEADGKAKDLPLAKNGSSSSTSSSTSTSVKKLPKTSAKH